MCEAVDIALVYGVRGVLMTLAGKQVLADKKLLFDDLIKYVYYSFIAYTVTLSLFRLSKYLVVISSIDTRSMVIHKLKRTVLGQ